jgi:hypothetical protein
LLFCRFSSFGGGFTWRRLLIFILISLGGGHKHTPLLLREPNQKLQKLWPINQLIGLLLISLLLLLIISRQTRNQLQHNLRQGDSLGLILLLGHKLLHVKVRHRIHSRQRYIAIAQVVVRGFENKVVLEHELTETFLVLGFGNYAQDSGVGQVELDALFYEVLS